MSALFELQKSIFNYKISLLNSLNSTDAGNKTPTTSVNTSIDIKLLNFYSVPDTGPGKFQQDTTNRIYHSLLADFAHTFMRPSTFAHD